MAHMIPAKAPPDAIALDVIAENIVAISAGFKKLRAGRLTDKAIVLLLHHATGVSQREVRAVMDGITSLEATYLKKRAS